MWRGWHFLACALAVVLVATGLQPATGQPGQDPTTFSNPISGSGLDSFPDPTMIRGKDGFWYAYASQNPIFQSHGEQGERILPVLRSRDMANWDFVGEVFTPSTQPAWHEHSRLWAPDIRYINGKYYLYYSVSEGDTVGLATAPTPTGPWTDRGPVLPRPHSGCPTGNIDPAQFTDADGTSYLYWGSYDTVCMARMNADSTRIEGPVKPVGQGRRMEGTFVVRRGGFYYLFYSDAGCCDGAYSGYQVKVGRSRSPAGPFRDSEGVDLRAPTSKGGIVVGANGNRWIGVGHNAIQTDLSGQDWLVYHGIPAEDPDFDPVGGGGGRLQMLSKRPMLMDRLDWIEGWPVVRGGAGASDGPQPAPRNSPTAGSTFNDGSLDGWYQQGSAGAWRLGREPDAGGYVEQTARVREPAYLVSAKQAAPDVRAEADLRLPPGGKQAASGLVVAYHDPGNHVVAWLDRRRDALVTDVRVDGGSSGAVLTPLPRGFNFGLWHNISAELRGDRLRVQVSSDRLHDSLAEQQRRLGEEVSRAGSVGTASIGGPAHADNLSVTPLFNPVRERVPEPVVREPVARYSDEFDGTGVPGEGPASPWHWVRGPDPQARQSGGELRWPTRGGDLYQDANSAPVLLRPAPPGDYTVETKLRFDPREPAQQAGLLLYENDDRYFKLVHSLLPLDNVEGQVVNQTEFGKEGERPTTTPPIDVFDGPMFQGPAARTLWLRLSYHWDRANNQHEVRASTSRDGQHWVHGGVWTLPVHNKLSIGLVSMNRPGALARFDYFHTSLD